MKPIPKIKEMTEEELKAWEKKLQEMGWDNINKDAVNKIKGGRGWMF
jgi:hypothetical protein